MDVSIAVRHHALPLMAVIKGAGACHLMECPITAHVLHLHELWRAGFLLVKLLIRARSLYTTIVDARDL